MKLYIDGENIRKAVQVPNTGVATRREDQSSVEYDSTYSRRYEGVASGEAYDPDDPAVGGKWGHGEPNTATVDAKRKANEAEDDEDEDTKKSIDILKSITSGIQTATVLPTSTEQEFLVEMGFDPELVSKGLIEIRGRYRDLFTDWLCDRLNKSIRNLRR